MDNTLAVINAIGSSDRFILFRESGLEIEVNLKDGNLKSPSKVFNETDRQAVIDYLNPVPEKPTKLLTQSDSISAPKTVRCLNNGKIYPSCKAAEKELFLPKNTVSPVARVTDRIRTIHGYQFEYVNNDKRATA
ncbi:hypothetical protein AAU57_12110 [Nonlabens sp. YIK11]|uniref:hypothetical protein n=1 Tax=Nonlabens sp. YIK11 TaxID=1453349 RepID=UPI0006DBF066|nr:hypothetical protein [Nonlabens sp. YIK11]KQC33992.1 hypothetical protein AAU57_12110 [Nonlabens sp. YIK11]